MSDYNTLLNSTFATRDLNYESFQKEALDSVISDELRSKWDTTVRKPNVAHLTSLPARHRGPRESLFFCTTAQSLISLNSNLKFIVHPLVKAFKTRIENTYPLPEVVADLQHSRAQIEFHEWIKLKENNLTNRWY